MDWSFVLFCAWAAPCILAVIAMAHLVVVYACWQFTRLCHWLDGTPPDKHPWDGNTT